MSPDFGDLLRSQGHNQSVTSRKSVADFYALFARFFTERFHRCGNLLRADRFPFDIERAVITEERAVQPVADTHFDPVLPDRFVEPLTHVGDT